MSALTNASRATVLVHGRNELHLKFNTDAELRQAYEEIDALAEPAQQDTKGEADDAKVICPACCHQFRAIPVQVQSLMLAAGFEPPFTAAPQSPGKPTHTTQPAESLMGIALRQLKNESRWTEIRDLNASEFPDMGPHDYYPVGTVLRLPSVQQAAATEPKALPDDLRALGWSVAVHNDYRLNGTRHTFWLLTRGNECRKGEGNTDAEALDQIRAALAADQKKGNDYD